MILIVDDDPSVTASLSLLLKQHGHRSQTADSPETALGLLERGNFDLVLQDMNFSRQTSGREGLDLLSRIRAVAPDLPVVLITAWGSIELAVEGMKHGASDFITKPWTNANLIQSLETQLSLREGPAGGSAGVALLRPELDAENDFRDLIGADPRFLEVLGLVARVARTEASVLITGESGTGKELVAEALHRNSRRSDAGFVKVNLGGISSTLFESEMFGHVRGAFTDARTDRKGRFERAHGGTIFLDEIGELEPSSQVKLLRVLQDRTYEVLGSSETRSVDVRVISATNRDLPELVRRDRFREDLLYRLNLIAVRVPALRERSSDIPRLASHFLSLCGESYGIAGLELTDRAVDWLKDRPWPGNIRQLKQTLERAVLVLDGTRLDVEELERFSDLEDRGSVVGGLPRPGSMTLDEMERAMIAKCMTHYRGNVTHVAEALGLSRAALYRRLERFGIEHGR